MAAEAAVAAAVTSDRGSCDDVAAVKRGLVTEVEDEAREHDTLEGNS